MNRKIPIISLEDFEAKAKKPLMMKSLVSNIANGIKENLQSVNIAEIKNYDIIISVPKDEWKGGLENALNYYIEKEEYEVCSKIKKLIDRLQMKNYIMVLKKGKDIIHKTSQASYEEAVKYFANIKQMPIKEFNKIFIVTEVKQ